MIKLYSYKDELTGFAAPFVFKNDGDAIRSFKTMVNDDTTIFAASPKDYSLYSIGEFNEETGEIKTDIVKLVDALSVKEDK